MAAKRLPAQRQSKTPEQALMLLYDAVTAREQAAARVDALAVDARMAGLSWETIGRALGITKQGAHQRYTGDDAA